jgi:NTP pyrophosphatase (non-canonical NTP hydrolase)
MTQIHSALTMQAAQEYVKSIGHQHNMAGAGVRIDQLCAGMHAISASRGWWTNLETGAPAPRNFGEMIALMHSELSEALEGDRKNLASDHIPGFSMVEEEFADELIRIFDCAGAMGLRLGEAFQAKCQFNLVREDHSIEARVAGGKQY